MKQTVTDYRFPCRHICGADIRVKVVSTTPYLERRYFAEGAPDQPIDVCSACAGRLTMKSVLGGYEYELNAARAESLALGLGPLVPDPDLASVPLSLVKKGGRPCGIAPRRPGSGLGTEGTQGTEGTRPPPRTPAVAPAMRATSSNAPEEPATLLCEFSL